MIAGSGPSAYIRHWPGRCIMKHAATLIALAAASVLGVAACGGGGGSAAPSHTAQPAPGTPTATAPAATTPAASVSGPMTGQELLWLQAVEQLLPVIRQRHGTTLRG